MFWLTQIFGNLISNIITPINTNSEWIKTGNVYCYKILNRYIIQFADVEFKKSDEFGYHSVLLWDFNLPNTTFVSFIIASAFNNDMVRLLNDNGKIYGHYDTAVEGAIYYGTVII